jgi:hypothetical protein
MNFYQKTEISVVPEPGVFYCVSFLVLFLLFLYYKLHSHYSLIPILSLFTFPPPLVLQSIVFPPNFSLILLIHSFPHIRLPPTTLSQPVTSLTLPLTHSPSAD